MVRALRLQAKMQGLSPLVQAKSLADSVPCYAVGNVRLVGPAVGAPIAALLAHSLSRMGMAELLLFGSCGAVPTASPPLGSGHIVFPRASIAEDLTTAVYGESAYFPYAPAEHQAALEAAVFEALSTASFAVHRGAVLTTDAPLLETPERLELFSKRGAIAVDMEFSALYRLSLQLNFQLSACFVVSDIASGAAPDPASLRACRKNIPALCRIIAAHIFSSIDGAEAGTNAP